MRRLRTAATLAVGILVAAASQSALGQTPASSRGSVGGTGVVVIKRQPELIRMQLEVMATGKDLKENRGTVWTPITLQMMRTIQRVSQTVINNADNEDDEISPHLDRTPLDALYGTVRKLIADV